MDVVDQLKSNTNSILSQIVSPEPRPHSKYAFGHHRDSSSVILEDDEDDVRNWYLRINQQLLSTIASATTANIL